MKLQVGDIQMDSERGIAFGAEQQPRAEREQVRPREIPRWVAGLGGFAALVFGLGAAGAAFYTQAYLLLIPAALLLRAAAYAAVLAVRPVRSRGAAVTDARILAERLDAERSATVEELVARMGWAEPRVLRALVEATRSGLLDEDLDVETGEWTYSLTVELPSPRKTLPAEERLEAIQTHNQGVS